MCLLSHSNRTCAAYLSLVLQMFLMVLGCLIIAAGVSIKVTFSEYERMKYDHLGEAFPNYLIVVGVLHLVYHTFGVQASLMTTDWRKIYIYKTLYRSISFSFIVTNLIFIVVLIVTSFLLVNYPDYLRDAWVNILNEAMRTYASNLDNKVMIDHIQFSYKCCGSKDDRDWQRVKWLRKGKVPYDYNYAAINKLMHKNFFRGEGVPWSCCDSISSPPCVNIFYRDASKHDNYSPDVDRTIYKRGCGFAISKEIGYWVNVLGILTYCFLFVEIFALAVFRVLQTSSDLALDWGDPTQDAQGYLCLCDVPPVPPGATLDPDKLAIRQQVLDEIAYKEEEDVIDNLKVGLMNKAWKDDAAKDAQKLADEDTTHQSNLSNNSKSRHKSGGSNFGGKFLKLKKGKGKLSKSNNNETVSSKKSNSLKGFDGKLERDAEIDDDYEGGYRIERIRDENGSRISSSTYSCSLHDDNVSEFESVSQRANKHILKNIKETFQKKITKMKNSLHHNNNKVKRSKRKKTSKLYDFYFDNIQKFTNEKVKNSLSPQEDEKGGKSHSSKLYSRQTSLEAEHSSSVTNVSKLDDVTNDCHNTNQNNADITTIWDSLSLTSLSDHPTEGFQNVSVDDEKMDKLFSNIDFTSNMDPNSFGKHEYLFDNTSNRLSFDLGGEDKFMCGNILKIPVNAQRIYSSSSSVCSSDGEINDDHYQDSRDEELKNSSLSVSNEENPPEPRLIFLNEALSKQQTTVEMVQIKPRLYSYLSPFRPIKYPVYREDEPKTINNNNTTSASESFCNPTKPPRHNKKKTVETAQTSIIGTEEKILIDLGTCM